MHSKSPRVQPTTKPTSKRRFPIEEFVGKASIVQLACRGYFTQKIRDYGRGTSLKVRNVANARPKMRVMAIG